MENKVSVSDVNSWVFNAIQEEVVAVCKQEENGFSIRLNNGQTFRFTAEEVK